MWLDESVFYQIYPIGFCGAPRTALEEGQPSCNRIAKVIDWINHIKRLGCNAVYFSPLFESDSHGYDTRDFRLIDRRLGSNQDFAQVCQKLHEAGIRVVLDGVFNHVGRGFWAFRDVQQKRWDSPYKDWFRISFDGNSPYNDGFWYEGWEGHYELVKLNLQNPQVVDYLLDCIRFWVEEFSIDGLRLDVAYSLDREFMKRLRQFTQQLKPDFALIGEVLHGDYNQIVNDQMLHSCTNYECYKGLYSSCNTMNLFEITHSLLRQFGPEQWTLYKGKHLLSFVDNHDVTRAASILNNKNHLIPLYGMLFGMPGVPCIYYGSEWGCEATKTPGNDDSLRPCFDQPQWNELCDVISRMAKAHRENKALHSGDFKQLLLTNKQAIWERCCDGQRVLIAINIEDQEYVAHFNANAGRALDLISGQMHDFGGGSHLPPYSVAFWDTSVNG